MDWNTLGLLALLLVCPIAMMLMMRGAGHGGHEHHSKGNDPLEGMSDEQLQELTRRAKSELDERDQRRHVSGR